MKFRVLDTKTGREVPVHRLDCDPRTGEPIRAVGNDYADPDSDWEGTVQLGGDLRRKTGKPGEPQRLRYILLVDGVPLTSKSPSIRLVIEYLESISHLTGHFVAAEQEAGFNDLSVQNAVKEIDELNRAIEILKAIEGGEQFA